MLLILIGDYTPKETFEKVCEISEEYIEIDQFETDNSSFKIGKRKINQVERGIYCYMGMEKEKRHIPVKLDYRDIRSLKKTVTMMKNNLAAYPTGEELAKVAGMSPARYLLAFRKHYGTTPYECLKEMRLNQALLLLKNSDYGIATIAEKVGYHNSGHFARLFKNAYGLGPREYRKIHNIK